MMENIMPYRFIIIPTCLWLGIQIFKVVYTYFETKKWDFTRFWGAGGMPSSHSAVVSCMATLIGKSEGITSPIFALSVVMAFIIMYDAAGVRRAVGKQAKVLNDIIMDKNLTNAEKLQEMTGHTPFQVSIGALIGVISGLIF